MRVYTVAELEKLPNISLAHLSIYINLPKDYVCKVGSDYELYLLYNPTTKHVIVYSYWESSCYVDSAEDIQFNGHYDQINEYTASEKSS